MRENISFIVAEAFNGMRYSRLSGFIATITVAISLVLVGIFLIITVNLGRLIEHLRSRVEIEVFLSDALDDAAIQTLSSKIREIEGVSEVVFISKEMAISEFERLFQNNGVDYLEVLGENPLPASFRIQLDPSHRSASGAEKVITGITRLDNISENDVVFRRDYLILLEKYINIAVAVDFIVGTIVCLSALLLVSNNIRLIISAKARIIETMKLVGATPVFIKLPFYIQGMLQGFMGGIVAALFLVILLKILEIEIPGLIVVASRLHFLLISLGVLLGIAGSFIAIRRHL